MSKGVHRFTTDSRQGRSMISPGREHMPWNIPQEIKDWNEQVDLKKRMKKAGNKPIAPGKPTAANEPNEGENA